MTTAVRRHKTRACGKVRFRDLKEAKAALQRIRTLGEVRETNPARAYECHACHGAHLTSQS